MVTLRHKLLLGFGGLLLIILLVGIQSIIRLTSLGKSIDVILRENYRSVIACENMKEALERMDSGALFVILGDTSRGQELIRNNRPRFDKALQVELDNITLPGEGERADRIRLLFGQYTEAMEAVLAPRLSPAVLHETYFTKLFPLFEQIKDTADEILQMNQQHMSNADMWAKQTAASARKQMYLLLIVAMIVAIGFIILADRRILRPLARLTRSARDIRAGNLEQVVPVESKDEVGQLSDAFNEMAEGIREFRRTDRAKLNRIQRATQAAFDSLPDAIAVVDLGGQVEVATGLARDVFGLKPNTPLTMLPDQWIMDLYEEVLRTGRPAEAKGEGAVIQRFIKNQERYFRPLGTPIVGHDGQSSGVVLFMHDVTMLRQQDEMKRDVIATVSHQLKTPLTSVRMAIHLLLSEKFGDLAPKQAELLMAARDDSERLQTIIEDLLDLSRMELGRVRMDLASVSPRSMVLEAVESFRRAAQDGGLQLAIDVPDDVPDVRADAMQIGHVFSNLLSNALKYTSPGGSVTVSARTDDKQVLFSVTDTGKGIPEAYRERVFEKFSAIPGDDSGKGVGLGLAIVKEIIDAHGGKVSVTSREGKGSTFTFSLPRADLKAKEETT
jgi:signal transduction histidine kinase